MLAANAIALAFLMALVVEQPATAKTSSGAAASTTPVPPWVTPIVDQPTPATGTLAPALWWGKAGHGPVISVSQAEVIFDAEWSLRFQAFHSEDPSVVGAFETGPALESDEVICNTCTSLEVRSDIKDLRLLVPDTHSFPDTFLGEAITTIKGAPYTQYLVISRQSASTPWMVVADPGQRGSTKLLKGRAGRGGFDPAPNSARGTQLPGDLAAYWQSWVYRGRAPAHTLLAPGRWTTMDGANLAKAPSGSLTAFNGLIGKYRYRAGDADENWSFSVAGGTLTCGVVRYQTTWSALGGYDWQPPDQTNWGPNVAPGFYADVVETQIAQPCFIDRRGHDVSVLFGGMDPETLQGQDPVSHPSGTPPGSQTA